MAVNVLISTVREEAQSHPGWRPRAGDGPGRAPLGSVKEIPRTDLHLFLSRKLRLLVPRDKTLSPAPALAQLDAGQARSARSARGSDGPGPHPRYQSGL